MERLKTVRKKAKETQTEIAKKLEITQGTYGKYERGEVQIPLEHLATLCRYYNISADYFLNLIDTPLSIDR